MYVKLRLYLFLFWAIGCHLTSLTHGEEETGGYSDLEEFPLEEETERGPHETVTLFQGDVRGFREVSSKGKVFYSFLGIPYAKPPVGSLRFKDPEALKSWEGVRDGSVSPPHCAQIDVYHFVTKPNAPFSGDEDCLHVNVYTPEPNFSVAFLPVLVYFHGGFFVSGGASDYEPYDILNENVVLVVIQFRLGVLGFMSTEDLVMPGNLGLKDQTLALRWIHENIDRFGGNPVQVTLFGSGSGAASIHFQTLSHHTIGLFNKAILQSGTALCPWANGGVHKEVAFHVGKKLKCSKKKADNLVSDDVTKLEGKIENENESEDENLKDKETVVKEEGNGKKEDNAENKEENVEKNKESETENGQNVKDDADKEDEEKEDDKETGKKEREDKDKTEEEEQLTSEELIECLQNVDVKKLTMSIKDYFMWMFMPTMFGPYADGNYIPETPEYLLKEKRHKRLDLIIGFNKDDGGFHTNSLFASEGRRMALKHHFPLIGPVSLEFSDDDVAPLNMSIKVYDRYAGGLQVDSSDVYNLTRLYTDRHYAVCSDLTALMHAENNARQKKKKKTYFYELHYRGQRSQGDAAGLSFGKEWVSHGDELYYLFPMNKTKDFVREEEDEKMSEMMIKMWTRFANTGNPTPDDSLGFTWETFSPESTRHLVLKLDPEMEDDTRKEAREFWGSLPTRQNIFLNQDYFKEILMEEKNKEENKEEETEGKEDSEERISKQEKVDNKSASYEKTEL